MNLVTGWIHFFVVVVVGSCTSHRTITQAFVRLFCLVPLFACIFVFRHCVHITTRLAWVEVHDKTDLCFNQEKKTYILSLSLSLYIHFICMLHTEYKCKVQIELLEPNKFESLLLTLIVIDPFFFYGEFNVFRALKIIAANTSQSCILFRRHSSSHIHLT